MTITSSSMRGDQPPTPRTPTPEQRRALAVMKSIDSGMTLTRYQIQAATKFDAEVEGEDITPSPDFFIRSALFALDSVEAFDDNKRKSEVVAIAIEALVLSIDQMDLSVEDVLKEALRVL